MTLEGTAADGDIATGIGAGGLQTNRIIAAVDIAIRDLHALAGVDIKAIVIAEAKAGDLEMVDSDMAALEKVGGPSGRTLEMHAADRHIVAANETDEKWPGIVTLGPGGEQCLAASVNGAGAF